jgi:hypothetical protein
MITIKLQQYKMKKLDHSAKQARYQTEVLNIQQIWCLKKGELLNYYNRTVNK